MPTLIQQIYHAERLDGPRSVPVVLPVIRQRARGRLDRALFQGVLTADSLAYGLNGEGHIAAGHVQVPHRTNPVLEGAYVTGTSPRDIQAL